MIHQKQAELHNMLNIIYHIRNMRHKKILHDSHNGISFTLWTSTTVPFSRPTSPKKNVHGKEQSPFFSKRMTEVSTQFILTGGAILNLWDKESMNSHTTIILLKSHQTTPTPQQRGWAQYKMRSMTMTIQDR